jgi:hypothetical protein
MKEARLYVDFNEMLEANLVMLSKSDIMKNSKGKQIELKEGLRVKIYSDDMSSCSEIDNLVAEGIVERNISGIWANDVKWNCRISEAGICNESQL